MNPIVVGLEGSTFFHQEQGTQLYRQGDSISDSVDGYLKTPEDKKEKVFKGFAEGRSK